MSKRAAPGVDARRADEFRAELMTRARAWLRAWSLDEDPGDFGVALIDVAARFSAQVAERLDRAGEKLSLGLLDWLAVRGKAAKPARMPVAFKLADAAREPVLAPKAVRLQADVGGASVAFETETPVNLVPGRLDQLIGVDVPGDKYFLPPPGISSLDPLEPLPDRWTLKNFANQNADKLQLDPALGLVKDTLIEMGGHQYRVVAAEAELVSIEPGVANAGGLAAGTIVTRVMKFDPFGGAAHNEQLHVVYLGDKDLFNIEAAATIEVLGTNKKLDGAAWEYFGKSETEDTPAWRPLALAPESQQKPGILKLEKPPGAVDPTDVGNAKGVRWIRASQTTVADETGVLETEKLTVIINRGAQSLPCPDSGATAAGAEVGAEGFANTTPLSFNSAFYPLGREPKQFDTFYLGSADAFSKPRADVSICFELADPTANAFSVLREGLFANRVLASVGGDGALHLIEADTSNGSLKRFLNHQPLQPVAGGAAVRLDPKPSFRLPMWAVDDNGVIPSILTPPPPPFGGGFGIGFGLGGIFGIGPFGFLGPFQSNPFFVATTAGNSVWVYKEYPSNTVASKWIPFGNVPAPPNANGIEGLVYLRDESAAIAAKLIALCGGQLFEHSAAEGNFGNPWTPVPLTGVPAAADPFRLAAIAPVNGSDAAQNWHGSLTDGIVGLFVNGTEALVYFLSAGGACVELDDNVPAEPTTQPAAAHIGSSIYVFWQLAKVPGAPGAPEPAAQLHVAEIDDSDLTNHLNDDDSLLAAVATDSPSEIAGGLLEIAPSETEPVMLATGTRENQGWIVSWTPFSGAANEYFETPLPAGVGPLGGAPTILEHLIVVPGTQSDAWTARWDPALRQEFIADLQSGIVVSTSVTPPLLRHDWVAIRTTSATLSSAEVGDIDDMLGSERFHSLESAFGVGAANAELVVYRSASAPGGRPGTWGSASKMTLELNDQDAFDREWMLIYDGTGTLKFFQVLSIDKTNPQQWKVTFTGASPSLQNAPPPLKYWHPERLPGRVAPFMDLDPSPGGNGDWDAGLLSQTSLTFTGRDPSVQRAQAFEVTPSNRPRHAVLGATWNSGTANANNVTFAFDASFGSWSRQLSENPANPKLMWEYWNGRAWDTLDIATDGTQDLKLTGRLEFAVPPTLAPTDVGGKTNHWIRARLIEGDYGREIVTVVTKPHPTVPNATVQEVVRDTSNFHPPLVVNMRIRYSVSNGTLPTYLLTRDSGSLRDQSESNRTQGALVEAFVPLSVLMRRLTGSGPVAADAEAAAGGTSTGGRCACVGTTPRAEAAAAEPAASAAAGAPDDRALLLGLDAGLQGEPVNILLLVEERDHDGFAPLVVEALVKDRFEALTVKDTTRALGESGLLSMSFPAKPSPRELFGRSLTWLRLRPSRAAANNTWRPVVRGAYLNAAWASATETLTREPLGSSDGRPFLTLRVARPPLLQDSLELRVREPLDEEERRDLLAADDTLDPDARRVKFGMTDLPGDWVLWRQVPDPADYGPHERVYALDETLGEVQFGDALHGMIPPIGRDAVVAFKYQRTEPAADGSDRVPANEVVARTALNLVTPVESVEAAFAADRAAGGAPPESAARVLRFGSARLRHRERAIVARDFEDLALASSPDIVQARALKRGGTLRLVVVMRGATPGPDAPQRRELVRLLRESASPLAGEPAIEVTGPRVRTLRLLLKLRVATLDDAGETARAARDALKQFFDLAAGGVDGTGWPLGTAPAEDDIAFALADVRGLEGIAQIRMREIAADGTESAWRPTGRDDELVMLAEDAVRIEFETLEVAA